MSPDAQAFLLAGVAAMSFDAGMLLLKARGDRLPPLGWPPALARLRAYGTDPLWLLGLALQPSGYAFYLWALALGPVAVVQPVMSAGIVVFVAFAVLILGERVRAVEWRAIGAVGVGLILLGSSLSGGSEPPGAHAGSGWIVAGYSAVALVLATGCAAWARGRAPGVATGIWSGVLLGLGSLYAKGLSSTLAGSSGNPWPAHLAAEPYLYLTFLGNILGFYVLLQALRNARAGVVFTISSTLSNVVPIGGAMLGMGERLPDGAVAAGLRIAALVLTLAGAASLARFDPGLRPAAGRRSPSA